MSSPEVRKCKRKGSRVLMNSLCVLVSCLWSSCVVFLMTSVMSSSSQIRLNQKLSFQFDPDSDFHTQHLFFWVFSDLKSLFCSHRLQLLLGGGFPLGVVVWPGLGGVAGEEDEVIFGLKDLREMKPVKPRLNASNGKCRVAAQHVIIGRKLQCW